MKTMHKILVGTYTERILFGSGRILDGKGEGIYLLEFDSKRHMMHTRNVYTEIRNPSYFAVSSDKSFLWTVNECKDYDETGTGYVTALKFADRMERLVPINTVSSFGGDPCHIITDNQEDYVFVSNYMGGSFSVYAVRPEGALRHIQTVCHSGHSVLPRQTSPHVHSIRFLPDSNRFYAADLGTDQLVKYIWEHEIVNPTGESLMLPAGSGPRQFCFASNSERCYVVDELSGCISFANGDLAVVIETWKANAPGSNMCSEVKLSRNKNFLYLACKETNTISIYAVDKKSGMLSPKGYVSCEGKNPRHFDISPNGEYLFCANQDSDCITVFSINKVTGGLNHILSFETPTPVFIKILS